MTSLFSQWLQRAATCGLAALLSGTIAATAYVAPAAADDIEVFFGPRPSQVNILFVFDTSATMWTLEAGSTESLYSDHRGEWGAQLSAIDPGAYVCEPDRVFFRRTGDPVPVCSAATPGISNSAGSNNLSCVVGVTNGDLESQLAQESQGVLLVPNDFSVSQYGTSAPTGWKRFNPPSNADLRTMCRIGVTAATPVPGGGTAPAANRYQSFSGQLITSDRLNWEAFKRRGTSTRIALAMDAAKAAINALPDNVRIGMMRFSGADSLDRSCDLSYYTGDEYQQYLESLGGGDGTGQAGGGMIIAPIMALDSPPYPDDTPPYVNESGSIQPALDDRGYAGATQRDKLNEILSNQLLVAGQGGACAVPLLTPNGRTPIAETLTEIRRYFMSQEANFGKGTNVSSSHPWSSDAVSMKKRGQRIGNYPRTQNDLSTGAEYVSPITEDCNPVTAIVLLSDGGTQQDSPDIDSNGPNSYAALAQLVRSANPEATLPATCDDDGLGTANSPSRCVDDLAELLYWELGVNTYTILYKIQNENQKQMLKDAAERSDGRWQEVESSADLLAGITDTFSNILSKSASFTSPAVAVNAFNRTQNADQVFMSLFAPSQSYRWNGNIKRYRLSNTGQVLDRNGTLAVNPATGYFRETSRSFWSPPAGCTAPDAGDLTTPDGLKVAEGGAANMLRCVSPTQRRLYREDSAAAGGVSAMCTAGATRPSGAELGLPGATSAQIDALVAYHCDQTNDSETVSPMGDPLHSRPTLFQYLVSAADSPPVYDATIFVTTNDGILHAIDGSNGVERWSFIPSDMLARTSRLETDPALPVGPDGVTPVRTYGLDGGVHLFRDTKAAQDANGNFPAYLFFGERRGGRNYYGLDISNPSQPRLMWKLDGAISNFGETWSVPVATYVIDPNNNFLPRPVVIFGGGYDDSHETLTGGLQPDSSGAAAIYIVDALDGTILWKADSTNYPAMQYAIPADIRVIDLIGADDIVDRLYASDLGGQLWRFDFDYQGITTGSLPGNVAETVVGGRIASLGGAEDTSSPAERRRFFYPPDAAILKQGGATFINLSIGSGHRQFPRYDQTTQDRLYSVRDNAPYAIRPEDSYTYDAVVRPDQLQAYVLSGGQITADPTLDQNKLNAGWYLQLEPGEKFLSETRTFGGQVFGVSTKSEFVTGSCPGYTLRNRLYVLDPKTGNAITNLDSVLGDDPYVDLELQDSISPEPVFLFPPDEGGVDPNTGYGSRSAPTCLVGLERCPAPLFNPPTRTFWKQRGMQ